MAGCAYCGQRFAEVRTPYQRMTVIDRHYPSAWTYAEVLMTRWQEDGELEREAIVDRRLSDGDFEGPERRYIRLESDRAKYLPR
ncbi:MAG: hypothetical protein ACYC6B_08245 [Thermoleophilia bacterium]